MIITSLDVALPLVKVYNIGILEILGNRSLLPDHSEELMQFRGEYGSAFKKYSAGIESGPAALTVESIAIASSISCKVGRSSSVHRYLVESIDGVLIYSRWTIEEIIKMFSLSGATSYTAGTSK